MRASEQQRPDVAAKRVAYQASIQTVDPARLVFLDESGVQTNMTRRYARAPQGQRAIGSAPGHGDHLTVLAAIDQRGPVGAAMTVAGGTTSAVFQTYLNDDLLLLCHRLLRNAIFPKKINWLDMCAQKY